MKFQKEQIDGLAGMRSKFCECLTSVSVNVSVQPVHWQNFITFLISHLIITILRLAF